MNNTQTMPFKVWKLINRIKILGENSLISCNNDCGYMQDFINKLNN